MTVKDEKDNKRYSLTTYLSNLTANNKMYIYKQDAKTGEYIMVNAKEYTTDKKGQLKAVIKTKNDFHLLNATDAAKENKRIVATVKAAKTKATVAVKKSTTMKMSSKLDTRNVKSITYTSSKTSVATVNKTTGKITAKKKGTATVKATVTLKNGTKKTVKMTVTVK